MKNTSLRKIIREEIDLHPMYGIVLDESDEFLLIAYQYDFFLDGYRIVRKSDVTSSTTSKSNRYIYKILKSEGLLKSLIVPEINIESWKSIFSSLGKGEFVIIENESVDDFCVGPIVRINKQSVVVKFFDGAGVWCDEDRINYKDISLLQFKCNYINLHAKYIIPESENL